MNRKSVLKHCFINLVVIFLQHFEYCSAFAYLRQHEVVAPSGMSFQDHNRLIRENAHPEPRGTGFGMPVNENSPNSFPRREHQPDNHRLQESDGRRRKNMRYWSIPIVHRPIHHDEMHNRKHHVTVSHKLPEKEFYSILADRETENRRLRAQPNEHNFVFDSIPSMSIHSSFQRSHPTQKQVLSKSQEIPVSSKKRNLVSTTQLNSKNYWWYPDSRTSSFQKTSHVPNEEVFFLIEFDDSDGDVTFETIMEIEELEDDVEFGHGQDEF